jgi:hypothetical protein
MPTSPTPVEIVEKVVVARETQPVQPEQIVVEPEKQTVEPVQVIRQPETPPTLYVPPQRPRKQERN